MRLQKIILAVLSLVLLGSTGLETLVGRARLELGITELTVCPQGPPVCQFAKIQEAIDAAAEGATIRISEGVYAENLVITKSLRLVGVGQEKVTLRAVKAEEATLSIGADEPFQVFIEGLTIGEPLLPTDPFRTFSHGVSISGHAQVFLRRLTVSGHGGGVTILGTPLSSPQIVIQGATISYNTCGIWASSHAFIDQVTIMNNIFGICGNDFTIKESNIVNNQIAGVQIFLPSALKVLTPFLKQSRVWLMGNLISGNGNGVLLYVMPSEPLPPLPLLPGLPQPRYVEIKDLAMIMGNRIADNKMYGVAFATRQCVGEELGQEFDPEQIMVTGGANEMHGNGEGDLCPADYPWPEDFVKP